MREFLANMAVGVKDGTINANDARVVIKAAEKITENFYAEIKVAKTQLELGRKVSDLGQLPIN
jgi:hypothetical protein